MARQEPLNHSEIEALLNELERKIEMLRSRYEQYFMGTERLPPDQLRRDVNRVRHQLESTFIRNTAQKFRLQSLVQRVTTYGNYWNRTMRQIEEGTYKRDVMRAQRNQQRREERESREEAYEIDLDLDALENLEDLQRELDEMDRRGAFDAPAEGPSAGDAAVAAAAAQVASGAAEAELSEPSQGQERRESIKQQRLDEIRRKLEMLEDPAAASSAGAADDSEAVYDERQSKLEAMRRKLEQRRGQQPIPFGPAAFTRDDEITQKARPEVPGMPAGGADYEKLRKLRMMKEKLTREAEAARTVQRPGGAPGAATRAAGEAARGAGRVIQRPTSAGAGSGDDDRARRVYDSLLEAKRRCNEPTNNLSFEAVKRSMDQQREHLRATRGARDVDFQVVIKDGKAYLKPETKD